MIQIDDAGSGSLVGGTIIGLYWPEKKIFKYEIIPLELYTPDNFKNKSYQTHVIDMVEGMFQQLSIPENEQIEVCQGYVFDALRRHLTSKCQSWTNVKIQGVLQEKVEGAFDRYAVSLGLPRDYILYTRYPFHFHKLLKWVYADFPHRNTLCKTGWKSWQKYQNLPLEVQTGSMKAQNCHCLKCGKKIRANSPVKVLKFFSNKQNIIYLHLNC